MTLDPDVAYWCEMAEVDAYRDVISATAELPGNPLGARLKAIGGGVAFALTALEIPFFYRVVGLGVGGPAAETVVEDVNRFYVGFERTGCAVQLAPHATPPGLVGWFEARGYRPSRNWVKMWHPLRDLPSATTDLRIEEVGPDRANDFVRIFLETFGMPPEIGPSAAVMVGRKGWRHYIGFDGETPVSVAAMRIEDGVAWFGYGGTLDSHRGRGGQSAMFARRLHDAREAGCRLAITETGEETPDVPNASYRNMVRAGFQLAYPRRNWVSPAPV